MIRVVLESPYAGDVEANERYARECMADSLERGEAPIASHLLYTQPGILDDTIPEERAKGIAAGFEWGSIATKVVVYLDNGMTAGMLKGVEFYSAKGIQIEYRRIKEPAVKPLNLCIKCGKKPRAKYQNYCWDCGRDNA